MAEPDWTQQYHAEEIARRYDRRYRGPVRRLNNRRVWQAVREALREAGDGAMPRWVYDVPAGTGRFTAELRAAGARVCSLDRSAAMLEVLRAKHATGEEVVGDLLHPPLRARDDACVLSLRLMQHYEPDGRIAALRAFGRIAPRAVVAYYPGWDWKNRLRRLRARLGLPVRKRRAHIEPDAIRAEAAASGWRLRAMRRVFPLLSENVLLVLERDDSPAPPSSASTDSGSRP